MSTAPRHNPHKWSSGAYVDRDVPIPNLPTEFDSLVLRLGLEKRPDLWQHSGRLRKFAKQNRTKRYVPESFLAELGMDGESEF